MSIKSVFAYGFLSIKNMGRNLFLYLGLMALFCSLKIFIIPNKEAALIINATLEILSGIVAFLFAFESFQKLSNQQQSLKELWSEGLYRIPRALLVALAFSLLFLVGLILFIVPSLFIVSIFGLAPLVPLFEPGTPRPFMRSKELVKRAPLIAAFFLIVSTLFEFVPLLLQGVDLPVFLKYFLMFSGDVIGLYLMSLIAALYYLLVKESSK